MVVGSRTERPVHPSLASASITLAARRDVYYRYG